MMQQSEQLSLLQEACETLLITTTLDQRRQLLDYVTELLKWNKTYNLTSIREPEQALVQHIFDSLAVVKPLENYLSEQKDSAQEILDVGSGAGLPGVVLAVILPWVKVTCVDAVEKKTSFIQQAASLLKLENLLAIHSRVENLNQQKYDVVTSRAFASLEDFATLAGDQVKTNGVLMAMKGKHPIDEIQNLQSNTNWLVYKTEQITVPQLKAERCLLWIKRKET
jgi:16S rRNA (guanine527-N7)-methyltransferase